MNRFSLRSKPLRLTILSGDTVGYGRILNPKGNSDTEGVMRAIKEGIVWPQEWDNPFDFEVVLNK